ncbi:UTRA domain-containing protein, partial [Staphylococcus haemolyticus]|uniref:UTRA domain-containing protein n=1 Tax=Staphylococcus haemolyticus TaxID=1283 RepID=UPI00374E51EB
NHQPVIYSLDKIPQHYLTSSHYQLTHPSILNPIHTNTPHKLPSPQTHLQPITYQPHISHILNPYPHQPLILLNLLHYHQIAKPILYSLNYLKT